ncbi:hypothetical protein B296_00015674 [Ensete ventricosum]|uniref:Uncharacterized protein n=1 Tax=Ensete ventricosum TaxID=4639 RepID=A0A426ZW91_ENSVE|nr:hypothetical protein B296_00015674 [Ensete ventricosum]
MERSSSFGTSWADQWDSSDHGQQLGEKKKKKKSSGGGGWKSGVEKTKAAASSGLKKVKEGSSTGFRWIKDKYHEKTRRH